MAPTTQICRRSARIGRKAVGLVVGVVVVAVGLVVGLVIELVGVAVGLAVELVGVVGLVIDGAAAVVGLVGLFYVTALLACAIFFTRRITLLTLPQIRRITLLTSVVLSDSCFIPINSRSSPTASRFSCSALRRCSSFRCPLSRPGSPFQSCPSLSPVPAWTRRSLLSSSFCRTCPSRL